MKPLHPGLPKCNYLRDNVGFGVAGVSGFDICFRRINNVFKFCGTYSSDEAMI